MTDKEIIKGANYCASIEHIEQCDDCPMRAECESDDGRAVKLVADLLNRQNAEIETLQEQVRVLNVPEMALPYDEDEFLRKAILEVIKWIEEMPHYKMFGTIVLTKTRVDEMKDRIKESKNECL